MRTTILSLLASLTIPFLASAQENYHSQMIFDPEKVSHGHVHASCVIEYPNGDLLAVWYENGPDRDDYYYTVDQDKHDNVRIGAARLRQGADQWSEPFAISDTFGVADNNPCLIVDKQERLWLFHSVMLGAPMETWGSTLLRYKISSNYQTPEQPVWEKENILIVHPNGLDEAAARIAGELRRKSDNGNPNARYASELLSRLNNPYYRRLGWMPRVHPTILPDGALLLPLANENFDIPGMAITPDGGESWVFSKVVPAAGIIQPSVVCMPDGKLAAFFRDGADEGFIKRSESLDNGMTWSSVSKTTLPNPGAGIEAVLLRDGLLAMVYNDTKESRDRLAVSLSNDGGETWPWKRYLENTPGGRFDYPSIIQTKDGLLHVTYSYHLKTIKHAYFSEDWIKAGER